MDGERFDEPVGLADRLDDLLVRIENWSARGRPLVIAAVVVAVLLAVGWWSYQAASAGPPVDDLIPLARPGSEATADQGAAGPGAGPTGDAGAAGSPPASPGASAGSDPATGGAGSGSVELVVHVVGEVRRPGLVTVEEGARVSDAVGAAGGATPDGDVERLNLASPLVDGMQIRVPVVDEADGGGAAAGEAGDDEPLIRLPENAPSGGGGAGSGPVDLNRASAAELEALPGIGPALAAAIVDWRAENGAFVTVDDLEAVPGIGPAKLGALRDLVVL